MNTFLFLVAGNTGCNFPFTYMNVTYTSCAIINGQSLCVASNANAAGLFPISLVACGGLIRIFQNKKKRLI